MSDDTVQDSSEPFDLWRWFRSWSYEKIHAVVYGAFIMFIAAMASSAYVLGGFLAIALWALGIRSSPLRYTKTGDPKVVYHDDDRENAVTDSDTVDRVHATNTTPQELRPHQKIFMEIRHKPHYFLGGGAIGEGTGRLGYYLTYGTQPDHWAQLPEVISQLMLGVM